MNTANRSATYHLRSYDEEAFPDDEKALGWLLQASAGFHPSEVFRRAMAPTSVVLFVVQEPNLATPVGVGVLEQYSATVGKISWVFVTIKHRGYHLGVRLLSELAKISVGRGDLQLDAFRTHETRKFFDRFGFVASKVLKHTVTLSFDDDHRASRQSVTPICDSVPSMMSNGDDSVKLRLALPSDKKEWCALVLNACNYDMGGGQMVQITLDAAFRCVAVAPCGDVVGLISMSATGWIPFLCCRESHRGSGLGSLLLAVAVEWLRRTIANAVPSDEHDASLSPLRRRNVAFYERKGFALDEPLKSSVPFEKNKLLMSRPVHPLVCMLPMPYCCLEDVVPEVFAAQPAPSREPDFGQMLDVLAASSRRKKKQVVLASTHDDGGVQETEQAAAPLLKSHRSEVTAP